MIFKAAQGDTGHAQATMITEQYAHILDDDRRLNVERFEKAFYSPTKEEPSVNTKIPPEIDQAVLIQLLQNPTVAALLQTLTQTA